MAELPSLIWILLALLSGGAIGFLLARVMQPKQPGISPTELIRLEEDLNRMRGERDVLGEKEKQLLQELAALRQKHADLELLMQRREEELLKTREELQKEFVLTAHSIFEEKSKNLETNSLKSLKSLLDPFGESIKEFKKSVEDKEAKATDQFHELRNQIVTLTTLNNTITKETRQLTEALKGENKLQGNWGELVLERILEQSGLSKDREYKMQVSVQSEEGLRLQPDAVIYLPDDRHIIIDSKVSLKAYEQYFGAETEEARTQLQQAHLNSIKSHIKALSEKAYPSAKGLDSPDFVLMFIPIEASFGMAVQADAALFEFAWERKIVMVTPSTLLATLRTIANIWKHEHQNQNAMEIAAEAGKLYDKFAGAVDDLRRLGNQFETAQKTYEDAIGKLADGRGNVLSKVENLKRLGVKPKKELKDIHPELYKKALGEENGEENED